MEDVRTQKRRHLIYYLTVTEDKTNRPLGRVVDITTDGLKVCTEIPIDINRNYSLRMDLPDSETGPKHVTFDAEGVWTDRDVNPDLWDIGFKMIHTPPEVRDTITELIKEYGFPDTSTSQLR